MDKPNLCAAQFLIFPYTEGTLKTWAGELGLNQSRKLLDATLSEEKMTDETLSELAESGVNQHAKAA